MEPTQHNRPYNKHRIYYGGEAWLDRTNSNIITLGSGTFEEVMRDFVYSGIRVTPIIPTTRGIYLSSASISRLPPVREPANDENWLNIAVLASQQLVIYPTRLYYRFFEDDIFRYIFCTRYLSRQSEIFYPFHFDSWFHVLLEYTESIVSERECSPFPNAPGNDSVLHFTWYSFIGAFIHGVLGRYHLRFNIQYVIGRRTRLVIDTGEEEPQAEFDEEYFTVSTPSLILSPSPTTGNIVQNIRTYYDNTVYPMILELWKTYVSIEF